MNLLSYTFLLLLLLSAFSACSLKPKSNENIASIHNTTEQTTINAPGDKIINITYPQNDEYWYVGDTVTIRWTTKNIPENAEVTVMLWDSDMLPPYPIVKTTNTGSAKWIVTNRIMGGHLRLSVHISGVFTMNPNYVQIIP
jgi:hypothetical protein